MMKRLFLTIEMNVVLWIVAGVSTGWNTWVIVGLVVGAVLLQPARGRAGGPHETF